MTTLRARAAARGLHAADGVAGLALLVLARLYYWRLDAYLINDDEGSYLYAAWRISLGELPYRDFLTPQLPAFLMPGGWLMLATGPDVWAARALGVTLVLIAGVFVWATARRLFGPAVAALAGIVFLMQPDVYLHSRSFRSEPFMLFFATLGVLLFARGAFPRPPASDPPRRRWLALSGAAFGLAMLAKLFGPLALGGCLLWLVVDAWWRRRPIAPVVRDSLALLLPFGLTVILGMGAFALASGDARTVWTAVVGHHLLQGGSKSLAQVAGDGLAFYTLYLRQNNAALLAFVAIAAGGMAWAARERRAMLFACQLPTALLFFFLSREKFPRHLVYLAPALATLFAVAVGTLAGAAGTAGAAGERRKDRWGPWLAAALVLAVVVPWWLLDKDHGFRWETGTRRLADFAELLVGPDEILLSDYSELNFYSLRPTTYAAASLSSGAAGSGQITWDRIERELGGTLPSLLLIDTAAEFAHLRFLTDRPRYEAWLAEHYGPPVGHFRRDHQIYEVHAPLDRPLPTLARFEGGPVLIAAAADRGEAASGQSLAILSAWQAAEAIDADLAMTLRLIDADGVEWAQADDGLFASDFNASTRVRPTSRWEPGELSSERLALTIPPGAPPGTYDLVLGLYAPPDPSGLAATDAAGSPLGRGVRVGQIRVAPWMAPASAVPADALDLDLRPAGIGGEGVVGADGAQLLGRGPLPTAPITAGATVPLDLWWSIAPGSPGRSAHITLSDPESGAVAADWSVPLPEVGAGDAAGVAGGTGTGTGTITVTKTEAAAEPGGAAIIHQRLAVPVLARSGAGRYGLGVTLEDAEGRPLGPAATDLGIVEVAARDLSQLRLTPPPVDRALDFTVGEIAELVGVDAPAAAAPGEPLDVALVWRALAPSRSAYKVTVQLLDESGRTVTQHDGEPADGDRPTTGWVPEEIIVDRHSLTLPEDLAPGSYRLVAAVYHPVTGVRLPVRGGGGTGNAAGSDAAGDVIPLGGVELHPPSAGDSARIPPTPAE